jgi:hypothetical protein
MMYASEESRMIRRPVWLKEECEITFVADHGIADEQAAFQ